MHKGDVHVAIIEKHHYDVKVEDYKHGEYHFTIIYDKDIRDILYIHFAGYFYHLYFDSRFNSSTLDK